MDETATPAPPTAGASADTATAASQERPSRSSTYSSIPAEDDEALAEIELKTVRDDGDEFSVTILDFAHKKFFVTVHANDSVLQLKQKGSTVHNVPVKQQRLIYRGKLLQDDDTLHSSGIDSDGLIVHLFPKPRVVVVNNNNNNNSSEEEKEEETDDDDNESTSARVPTIVLDADEAAQRSQILVLGSMDYIEAVNNVKLFSFMLLIISSIELLNLMSIGLDNGQAMSNNDPINPWEDHDDFFDDDGTYPGANSTSPGGGGGGTTNFTGSENLDPALAIYETWQPLSYMDVVVSLAGVFVALLGIKATNENTLPTARWYLTGTCIVAAGWLVYNYLISLEVDEAVAEEIEEEGTSNDDYAAETYSRDNGSVYDQAFQVMVLPAMVWFLCIFRAWQFQSLLAEAEQEATDRIAAEVGAATGDGEDDGDQDDEELALQNPSAVLS